MSRSATLPTDLRARHQLFQATLPVIVDLLFQSIKSAPLLVWHPPPALRIGEQSEFTRAAS